MKRDRRNRMGKRAAPSSSTAGGGGGGVRRSPSLLPGLLHHVESSQLRDVDDVVNYLRSTFSQYSRMPMQPLTRCVRIVLSQLTSRKPKTPQRTDADDSDDDKEPQGSSRKGRLKKDDGREEKLRRLEDDYVRRNQRDVVDDSSSLSESESDSEGGGVSTSEDAIYSEKVEPEFDLTKSMLRASYGGHEEKIVEIDDGSKEKEVAVIGGRDDQGRKRKRVEEESEVKGKEGTQFRDLGGMKKVVEELKMNVIYPLRHPELLWWLGVRPIVGILLHGPPGCGKTKLAHAIANESSLPFYKISATEIVSGVSGASEENIRELFSKAYRTAPSIVFIDEIDAIASKRENLQREMEKRIVTQLMTCMDDSQRLVQAAKENVDSGNADSWPGYVLVIGATNRPDAIDPALRRPGRFDQEIAVGIPDENARADILSVSTHNLRLEGDFNLLKIAKDTPGFVGADLTALANKAGLLALQRVIHQKWLEELSKGSVSEEDFEYFLERPLSQEEMSKLAITMSDFEEAAKLVQPSLRREGFSAIPNVKWEDVGGLTTIRQEFERHLVRRIKYPEYYKEFGVDAETGFLLYGPPGCGKTLIAKAAANEAGANFIHIKGPELLSKYVGETELNVRTIFSRARTCSPCILFFDEVDAITTNRGKEGGSHVDRLLNQLLIELDGAEEKGEVYVIGATNRPEIMDPAVLRPGRFGRHLYVPLPTPDERGLILQACARRKPVDVSVDLHAIAKSKACENLSGADLALLMNEAGMAALDEKLNSENDGSVATRSTIMARHFEQAMGKVKPSVSVEDRLYYAELPRKLRGV